MNEKKHQRIQKQFTVNHPRRIAKGELAAMLGFSRSDKMIPMFKELLKDLDWTIDKYLKIQVFNMAQTKDVLTVLFQKELISQQNIIETAKDLRLNINGQTTITIYHDE